MWVQMGADGFGWVPWGVGRMRGHRNNACRDKNGHAGPDLGRMAGEISPNIMFLMICRIWVFTDAGG